MKLFSTLTLSLLPIFAATTTHGAPLGKRGQTLVEHVPALKKFCPKVEAPPPDAQKCSATIERFDDARAWIGLSDREHPEVIAAMEVAQQAKDTRRAWFAYEREREATAQRKKREWEAMADRFRFELKALADGSNDRASRPLYGAANAGVPYVVAVDIMKQTWTRTEFDKLGEYASYCKEHNTGSSEEPWKKKLSKDCSLLKKRAEYKTRWIEASVRKNISANFEPWENAAKHLKDRGQLAQVNMNTLTSKRELQALGGDHARAVVDVTGVKVSYAKELDAQVSQIQSTYHAALKKWAKVSRWKEQAGRATKKDGGGKKAVAARLKEEGFTLVRFGVYHAAWEVERGALDQPIQRRKDAAVMARGKQEGFCRIYHPTLIQEHRGGGRYGKTQVERGMFESFYVSSCR